MRILNYFIVTLLVIMVTVVSCKKDPEPTPVLDTPELAVNLTSVDFGALDLDVESDVLSVALTAKYLTADVTATVPTGFHASLSQDSGFGGDNITIPQASFDNDATVSLYVKVLATSTEGPLTGTITVSSTDADNVTVALSASIALQIAGELLMSEYFEQYDLTEWDERLPLDSGIMSFEENIDTLMNFANAGCSHPETTIANNLVMNTWHMNNPTNSRTHKGFLGLNTATNLSITGYPAVNGARDAWLDNDVWSNQHWTWVKRDDNYTGVKTHWRGNNTSVGRRFAVDGTTTNVFLSAMVNIAALGALYDGTTVPLIGEGDIISLANANTGASNSNCMKIVAITDDAGGFHFGLLKDAEGNPPVLSTESYALNENYAVVMSYEFVEGDNNDVAKLYVFAEGDEIPPKMDGLTPVAVVDASYTAADGTTPIIDAIGINLVFVRSRCQNIQAPRFALSGIRVGTSWVATLFEAHENATVSNDLTLDNRVLNDNDGFWVADKSTGNSCN
ncbi:MAG: hypothetical protein ABFS32_00460 [Bacteroidota bacterium]